MSTHLTIPAGIIDDVRESLFGLLGGAAEAILHSLEQPEREYHPEWFRDDRRELEDALALLDLAGWDAARRPRATDVELIRYGSALKQAAEGYLPCLEDQEAAAEANDRRRTAEGKPPRKADIARRLVEFRSFAARVDQAGADVPD
jgi:hypothetical protein